jgi:hypothetical protein
LSSIDYTEEMKTLKLHSKLIELQGQVISRFEGDNILSHLRRLLLMESMGQISKAETGSRIRQAGWKIAEDLQINGLAVSAGSDESLLHDLPILLKV